MLGTLLKMGLTTQSVLFITALPVALEKIHKNLHPSAVTAPRQRRRVPQWLPSWPQQTNVSHYYSWRRAHQLVKNGRAPCARRWSSKGAPGLTSALTFGCTTAPKFLHYFQQFWSTLTICLRHLRIRFKTWACMCELSVSFYHSNRSHLSNMPCYGAIFSMRACFAARCTRIFRKEQSTWKKKSSSVYPNDFKSFSTIELLATRITLHFLWCSRSTIWLAMKSSY